MRPAQRKTVALLIGVTACFWASLYLYVPILTPYAEQVGASLTFVGLIVGSYGFSQLVLRIPTGILSDRIGRRRPFILFAFVASIGAGLGLAVAGGPWGVLAARTLSGVSATMWVVITVLFSSYFRSDEVGYSMSLIMFTTTASQLVTTWLGGLIADAWGWRAPFWGAVAIGLAGLVLASRVKETQAKAIGLSLRELVSVGRDPLLLWVSLLAAAYQFNTWVTAYGFTPNYAVTLGASRAELGWLSLATGLPTALGSLASGLRRMTGRVGEIPLLVAAFTLVGATSMAIPAVTSLTGLYVTQAVGGLGRGLLFPTLMAMSIRTVPDEKRATAMGFFQSIYAVGMFGGPAVSGAVAEAIGLSGAFYTGALVVFAGAALTALFLGRRLREAAAASGAIHGA